MPDPLTNVEFCVLGPLRVITASGTHLLGRNQRSSILAMLLCRAGRLVSYDSLANELGITKTNVMKAKSKLTADLQACGPGVAELLITAPDGYRLDVAAAQLDSARFDRTVEQAERLLESDSAAALSQATAALSSWASPYQGVPATAGIDDECVRLEDLHRRAELAHCGALVATGQAGAAESAASALLRLDPDDEMACHYLVVALGMLGRQSDALDRLKAFNEVRAQRGTEPSAALRALEDKLIRGDVGYAPRRMSASRPRRTQPVRPVRFRLNTSCRFVGADRRLGLLDALARKVRRSGSAVCYLEGLAGIGKTRLVEEWMSSYDTAGFRECWLGFRSSDDGAFRRVVQMLRVSVGLAADDQDDDGDLVDDVRDERLIRAVLGRSGEQPLMIVVEDLHWADLRSLDFFDRLVSAMNRQGATNSAAVLLVATSRPVDPHSPIGSRLERIRRGRVVSWLTVERLSELEVHELVRGLGVPRPAVSLVRSVHTVSAGNPLAVRALISRLERIGALLQIDGQTVIDPATDELPPVAGIDSLVAQQLATFDDTCRRTLLAVAVLADHAHRDLIDGLIAAADLTVDEIDEAIGEAVRAGLALERSDRVEFDHPATAQIVLDDAGSAAVRALHRAAAEELIAMGPDAGDHATAVTWIAHHLTRAGHEADPRQIVRYCTEAGDLAMSAAAWSDADRYLSAALLSAESLGWPPNLLAELRLNVARASFRDHQVGRAAALFARVADFGRESGDPELWGQGLVQSVRCMVHDSAAPDNGTQSEALAAYLRATEHTAGLSPSLRAGAEQLLATLAWGTKDYRRGAAHAERALELAAAGDDALVAGQAALLLGLAQHSMLELEQSLVSFRRSTTAASSNPGATFSDWGRSRAALSLWPLGELSTAEQEAMTAALSAEDASNWAEACLARTMLAGILQARGDMAAARVEAEAAHRLFHRSSYYWAGTMLLPVRLSLAIDADDDPLIDDTLDEWGRTKPFPVEAMAAIHRRDRPALVHCATRLRRRHQDEPTMSGITAAAMGAELAVALDDADLARWCLPWLLAPAAKEVVLVLGPNRLLLRSVAQCHTVLGDRAAASAALRSAVAAGEAAGAVTETDRARRDLADIDPDVDLTDPAEEPVARPCP